ncbi:hypothetical protein MMF93_00505 [Streptomyces tubbatahanensis]|uniref:Integral membrane protein n=1 Tax=Streptomyces tubbatahanensis TaxID=2923272 RepID=A0ABY3XL14_9ACTN|nr:hypothetical protein [Streptomyces tubbatahanensis]UNS95110.1 hypothetical protein MMF93_00505 [Streptomyces tubbatahanensis]
MSDVEDVRIPRRIALLRGWARCCAGVSLGLVVLAALLLFVGLDAHSNYAQAATPSCGSLVLPDEQGMQTASCHTSQLRQAGRVGLTVVGALGCVVGSVLLRLEETRGDGRRENTRDAATRAPVGEQD